jgi:hypothetical protein
MKRPIINTWSRPDPNCTEGKKRHRRGTLREKKNIREKTMVLSKQQTHFFLNVDRIELADWNLSHWNATERGWRGCAGWGMQLRI